MAKPKNAAILGVFEGECADSTITNLNGLDITREVWENVFNSEEYKTAIELGHLIGFLGHPDDPACQDFEHACIVMTSGRIESNGKVYGTFNLVDTPVGRIVKAFIDAGVTFGISVRGAGDIVDNSVDPDTFVFRGFDLVTFPAYPESIPKFTPLAASTDVAQQKKFKNVCAAVHNNIDQISSVETIEMMKTCVAAQSDPYKDLDKRQRTLEADSIIARKLDVATDMYLQASQELRTSRNKYKQLTKDSAKKLTRVQEIMAAQQSRLQQQVVATKRRSSHQISSLRAQIVKSNDVVASLQTENLNYKREIQAAKRDCESAQTRVSELQSQMRETVTASKPLQSKVSNLDAENRRLKAVLTSMQSNLSEFQKAYCQLYASAIGGRDSESVAITASTTVADLKRLLGDTAVAAPTPVTVEEIDDICPEDTLVTI